MNTFLKKEDKPILLGLTGGIGSGKSTVAKIFKSLGIPVFNSDLTAKGLINNDNTIIEKITSEFGNVYQNRRLDSKRMADIVFSNDEALEKLNSIVHPRVGECFTRWLSENRKASYVIKEAAILIESGAFKQMDKIILVTAPEKIRIARVIKRDNVGEKKVKARISSQTSDEEKLAYADYIITNDGKELITPQVMEIFNQLKKP